MKVILFGASGALGARIAIEAMTRGHSVTAVTRDPAKIPAKFPRLTVAAGDAADIATVARLASGHDAAVSALAPPKDDAKILLALIKSVIEGVRQSGVKRLLVVGGAGTLEVAPGRRLMDQSDYADALKPIAQAHAEVLDAMRRARDLDWTVICPAANLGPGERTGKYRTADDRLVADAQRQSRISAEDFAAAMLDEIEKPAHSRRRFAVGY